MHKYIGSVVSIIYLDRLGRLSKRRIRIQSIKGDLMRAYDYERGAPRVFKCENILALQPVKSA